MSGLQPNLLESPATSPSRSGGRHQIKRSISELTSPVKLHRHHSHRGDYRRQQQHDDKIAQLNPLSMQARYSLDIPRSEGGTPVMSPDQSRRASVLIQRDGDDKADSRASREERLLGEQEKATFSKDGLRQSLQELNAFSTDTTRHLDETYYAVLEKMSALQNTVMALKDLAESSRDIQVGFERVAQELESDITKQLRGIGKFEAQQSTIEALQARIHQGREKMEALAARVDIVRERVEGWERADKAWRDRTRKRLRITWTVLSILILLIIILLITVNYSSEAVVPSDPKVQPARRNETPEYEVHGKATHSHHVTKDDGETETKLVWTTALDDGERLRVFDEL